MYGFGNSFSLNTGEIESIVCFFIQITLMGLVAIVNNLFREVWANVCEKTLNLFTIVIESVIVPPVSLKRVGNDLLGLCVDNTALIVFHVFLKSCLKLVKHVSKNIRLATRMLLLRMILNVFRLDLSVSYSGELGFILFRCLYMLSLNLMDRNIP